jgi:hypothetical protein
MTGRPDFYAGRGAQHYGADVVLAKAFQRDGDFMD